jgi:hypothetical protein
MDRRVASLLAMTDLCRPSLGVYTPTLDIVHFFRASSRKVAVIEDQDIPKRVGTLHTADRKLVAGQLREHLVGY